jgi:hypothetical protein
VPKYFASKVYGYYLYYTSFCLIECMHVHASDSKLTEAGSAKFYVRKDGSSVLQRQGVLSDIEVRRIQAFIKEHYVEMYELWRTDSPNGFYEK